MLNIASIINLSNEVVFNFHKKTLLKLTRYSENHIIINVGLILNQRDQKQFKLDKEIKKKFNYVEPKSSIELFKILRSKKFFINYCLSNKLQNFKINLILNLSRQKILTISDLGYNPKNNIYTNNQKINNFKNFFLLRIEYFFVRILSILRVLHNIDYFFEASNFTIRSIKEGISYKISKIYPFLNFSYYKEIIKINSRHYYKEKIMTSDNYIVFVDSMINHEDRIMREGKIADYELEKYYQNLNNIFINLSSIYKKNIIFCIHPKNDISIIQKKFLNIKFKKFQTEKYIRKAFIVIFHESSAIIQAILLKKKNIIIKRRIAW